jgi:hypothetical protein
MDRLQAAAWTVGAVVLPGHDPEVWAMLPKAFG